MKHMILSLAVVAATTTLAACGGGNGGSSGSGSSDSGLSVRQINGVGAVLVDARGMALYSARQEAGGRVLCSGGCLSFWMPARPVAGKAPAGVAKLGTVKRPDGSMQLTAGSSPLYTFAQDAPGKASGNGISDRFGSRSFTWHALTAAGAAGAAKQPAGGQPAAPSRGSYGY